MLLSGCESLENQLLVKKITEISEVDTSHMRLDFLKWPYKRGQIIKKYMSWDIGKVAVNRINGRPC